MYFYLGVHLRKSTLSKDNFSPVPTKNIFQILEVWEVAYLKANVAPPKRDPSYEFHVPKLLLFQMRREQMSTYPSMNEDFTTVYSTSTP